VGAYLGARDDTPLLLRWQNASMCARLTAGIALAFSHVSLECKPRRDVDHGWGPEIGYQSETANFEYMRVLRCDRAGS
jgi:hypothetical protein